MLLASIPANAKGKDGSAKNDSVPLFNGFAVSVDLVGPVQMLIGDYGQYEAALRINLKDRYFPIVEAGIGKADHTNDFHTRQAHHTGKSALTSTCLKTSTTYTGCSPD